jgi:ribosome biogenesis GTPase
VHIEPFLIVTKIDLPAGQEFFEKINQTYSKALKVLAGFEELKQFLTKDMTLILVGVSGAGKSTLINQLVPGANQKIGELSEHRQIGKHTTSGALMLELPNGGELIDSAGIRDFTPVNLSTSDLGYYFPGFETFRNQSCKFRDCKHVIEPGCTVRENSNPDDYRRYLQLLEAQL